METPEESKRFTKSKVSKSFHPTNFIFISLNCQSVKNKILNVLNYLYESKTDIALLQETWLRQHDRSIFKQMKEFGFQSINHTREEREGGGVSILYKNNVNIYKDFHQDDYKYTTFETILCCIVINNKSFVIVNVYRTPYSNAHRYTIKDFLIEFEEYLGQLTQKKGYLIIFGDFNINLLDNSGYKTQFLSLLDTFNLHQTITNPTHNKGSLIDLILLDTRLNTAVFSSLLCKDFKTDHYPLKLIIKIKQNSKPCIENRTSRCYKDCDINKMSQDIQNNDIYDPEMFSKMSLEDCVALYNSNIFNIVNKRCPLSHRKVRTDCQRPVWYNSTLQKLKQSRRRMERQYKKHPTAENKYKLKEIKNYYNKKLKTTRSEFYKNKISNSISDPKRLFKILGSISGTTKERILPTFDSNVVVAEKLSAFFVNKVINIRNQIQLTQHPCSESIQESRLVLLDKFNQTNITELSKIIASMKKKTSKLDPAPTAFLMRFINELLPIILHIINTSITQSHFPEILKQSEITPVIKNSKNNPDDLSGYRPIINLSFLSKVLEHVIHLQLQNHLNKYNFLAKHQSAYRSSYSCETAIIKVVDDIQEQLFAKKYVVLLLLDSSSAFDTVDHHILIQKLRNEFYLGDQAIKLIQSYLNNRTSSVVIGEAHSKPIIVEHGVPQGSLLGPTFYNMYTKNIEQIAIKYNISINLYADDAQLYTSFSFDSLDRTQNNLINCLSEIKTWMDSIFQKLNTSKTQLKIFKPDNIDINFELNYNHTILQCSDEISLLGVVLTKNLDLNKFISKKVKSCNLKLRNLFHIRDSLPYNSRVIMVTNLILSNLDYGNSILACASDRAIKPLQLVLNRAIRFIFKIYNRRTHITPFLKKLHILPVKYRILFKLSLIAFKVYNETAPLYLLEKFNKHHPTTTTNLRIGPGRDPFMFEINVPSHKRETLIYKMKRQWNSLPIALRRAEGVESFKTKLKTRLFLNAF